MIKANIYKIHYENGSQELVVAQSEEMIAECCDGVNQVSNVLQGARVLMGKWQEDGEILELKSLPTPPIKSEGQQADELLASVPTAVSGESA